MVSVCYAGTHTHTHKHTMNTNIVKYDTACLLHGDKREKNPNLTGLSQAGKPSMIPKPCEDGFLYLLEV